MKKCLIEWFNACRLMLNAIAAGYFLTLVCTGNYLSGISVEHRVLFTFLGIYGAIGVIVNFGILNILDDMKNHAIGNILPIAICDLIFGSVVGGVLLIIKDKDSENNDNWADHDYGKNSILK